MKVMYTIPPSTRKDVLTKCACCNLFNQWVKNWANDKGVTEIAIQESNLDALYDTIRDRHFAADEFFKGKSKSFRAMYRNSDNGRRVSQVISEVRNLIRNKGEAYFVP